MNLIFKPKSKGTYNRYATLVLTIVITIVALMKQEVSVFYIVFLFYLESVISTLFDIPRVMLGVIQVKSKSLFMITYFVRLIVLGMYGAGVIVFFGIFLNRTHTGIDSYKSIFELDNVWFNYNVLFIIIAQMISLLVDKKGNLIKYQVSGSRDYILHISIMLSGFALIYIKTDSDNLKLLAQITPFLASKAYFELKHIKNHHL